jgi:hypothetical protein
MAIRITDSTMTVEEGNRIAATARFSEYAAANGQRRVDRFQFPGPAIQAEPGNHGVDACGTPRRRLRQRRPVRRRGARNCSSDLMVSGAAGEVSTR